MHGVNYCLGTVIFPQNADDLKDQVIASVNAGIDLLMEPAEYRNCSLYLVEAVKEGKLPMPWYSSVENIDDKEAWLEEGYGLMYNKQ